MNSYHPQLKFTIEFPNNIQIPYLDLMIIKKEYKIVANWYSKPTSKGLLSFHSNHLINMKIKTSKGFLNRIFELSDECFWKTNKTIALEKLKRNEYSATLIQRLIYSEIRKIKFFRNNLTNSTSNNDSIPLYIPFLYIEKPQNSNIIFEDKTYSAT